MKKVIVFFFCCLPLFVWAKDDISGHAKFLNPELIIGEKIFLEVEIKAPKSYIIHFPTEAPKIEQLQMFGEPEPTTQTTQAKDYIYKKRYAYIAFDKVTAQPQITIPYTQNDKEKQLEIQVDAFQVKRIAVDSLDTVRTPYPPMEFQKKMGWKELVLGLLFILALILVYLFIQWRKGKNSLQIPPEEEPRPWALKQIDTLNNQIPFTYQKEAWILLTDVVRLYIQKTWNIQAPYQSTGETLFELSKKERYHEMIDKVSEILSLGDEIKFAGADSNLEQQKNAIRIANDIINFEPHIPTIDEKEEVKDV
ncbi:MAG: hypothetical protein M9887_06010 [Chitinophagales bacterium]|nr:hypothetical protein [Chitinophagales bacterium]